MVAMGRKSRVAKAIAALTEPEAPEAQQTPTAESQWWTKLTLRQFKDTIANLDRGELEILLGTIQAAKRKVILRQHVEDLPLEGQKAAARIAPIHGGCAEAVLTRMHSIPKENKPLAG